VSRSAIRLLRLPRHGKTLRIFREMLAGYDLIAYTDCSPASYLFLRLPRVVRHRTKMVWHAEAPWLQLTGAPRQVRFLCEGIVSQCDAYTAITEFVARDVFRLTNKQPSHILPVGVDTTVFTPPVERPNGVPVVLFAGTLMERKGPQYVV